MITELKYRFGEKCSGINVNGSLSNVNKPSKQLKFCEAVNYSFDIPIQINRDNLGCPGARRSIGFDRVDIKFAKFISKNTEIPKSFISDVFTQLSILNNNVFQINLGITQKMEKILPPDVYIIYVDPNRVTEIMHVFAQHKIQLSIPTFSLLSVCGNVFANSYVNKVPSVSFGCPESRKYGGVEDNEVVMGIPSKLLKYVLN